jgi:hypothetical protein
MIRIIFGLWMIKSTFNNRSVIKAINVIGTGTIIRTKKLMVDSNSLTKKISMNTLNHSRGLN